MTTIYDDYMRSIGIRTTQMMLLMALELAGPVSVTCLSDFLMMDRTTLTRDMKLLEQQGLVSITKGEDRRKRYMALTSEGKALLAQALPLWEQAHTYVRTNLGEERHDSLLSHLSAVVKLKRER